MDESSEIGVWLKIFVVCFFGLGTAIGLLIFFSGKSLLTRASTAQASLRFKPDHIVTMQNEAVTVQVVLNTGKAAVRGSDVVISYDPTFLRLQTVTPLASTYTAFKTYVPMDQNRQFNMTKVVNTANLSGRVEFGVLAADMQNEILTKPVNGNLALAELTFIVQKDGMSYVRFLESKSNSESTVVENIKPPINILTETNILLISTDNTSAGISSIPIPSQ